MNELPEEEEVEGEGPDVHGRRGNSRASRASGARGSHAVVPANLRGPRARASRNKIKESLTDSTFETEPVENHFNRR